MPQKNLTDSIFFCMQWISVKPGVTNDSTVLGIRDVLVPRLTFTSVITTTPSTRCTLILLLG